MTSPDQITVSQLAGLLGRPDMPVLVDICLDEDFEADPRLIPGAFRHPFDDIEALVPELGSKEAIVICQKGLKLSQGAASLLRSHGIAAGNLEGGNFAWRDAGQPLIPAGAMPPRHKSGGTCWVTGVGHEIGRIACPWLISRFIDPKARFLFVEASQVMAVAERFGAAPFDIEGAFSSPRAERCTFDIMLEQFQLETGPLLELARIVRGVETNRRDPAPQCAGLRAALLGISRMYKNHQEQLEAGFALYDAFYRWVLDARGEGHDHSPASREQPA
ncbi:chromate resistance protein ChrB domain-containing protein [Salaquimonas pukyongi]|uniref:chromate resistance protein ChrB domain-containing protein n=1 Tax=Salaquimonas pukyongi TaxID=2712698 RepID=UPI00096B816C|nr:chromate resistance protein ChrB domain-containing protein [Salaquimonas pukyongi]